MEDPFVRSVQQFIKSIDDLQQLGIQKKKIAHHLCLYPSVLSVLINRIFIKIDHYAIAGSINPEVISQIFSGVNNISEKKIRKEINNYNQSLKGLKQYAQKEYSVKNKGLLDKLVIGSPYSLLLRLEGLYYCYYVNPIHHLVVCEPFMIKKDIQSNNFVAHKGNKGEGTLIKGVVYISNSQVFSVQLLSDDETRHNHFFAHFNLANSDSNEIESLKGIAVSITESKQPMSFRAVLKKISVSTNHDDFESLDSFMFAADLEQWNSRAEEEIFNYLTKLEGARQTNPIPHLSI